MPSDDVTRGGKVQKHLVCVPAVTTMCCATRMAARMLGYLFATTQTCFRN